MLQMKSYVRACLFVLLAVPLLTSTCQTGGGGGDAQKREEDERLKKLNAESTFDVAQKGRQLLLAVEVSVKADGVEAVGAKLVRAPAPPNSAEADLLVSARAGERVLNEYTIPDPRLAEVDRREGKDGGLRVLPEGRTFVFAPLSEGLTEIRIAPVKGREERASKGGTLDVRALARRACEGQDGVEECRKILAAPPPPPPPSPQGSPAAPAQTTPTPTGTVRPPGD